MEHRTGRHRTGHGAPRAVFAVLTVALLGSGVVGLATAGAAPATAGSHRSDRGATASLVPNQGTVCNAPSYVSDSSLFIPLPNANGTLGSGGTITVTLQFAVVASTGSATGKNVSLPSAFATFPLNSGTRQIDLAPTTVPVPASGWSTASSLNRTVSIPTNLSFRAGANATLSTQKVAVMAAMNYSTLTLEFRWSWSMAQPNGSTTRSGWSTPTGVDHRPSALRSIFFPAPYVSFLGSSGATATIGTNYTATIGGDVAGRYFLLEMEFPATGKVVQAQGQTAPKNASSFGVFIPVLSYTRTLSPGSYLVHIHDACGALLYNKAIRAVFASNVTVRFAVSPTGCGVDFNGTNEYNGSTTVIVPSVNPFPVSVGCTGHTFDSWSGTGGIHVQNGHSVRVSAGGTFSVVYR
jgi:hypothetical protein